MFMVAKLMFFCKITTISPRCQPLKTISPGGYHIDFQFYQKIFTYQALLTFRLTPKERARQKKTRIGVGADSGME